MSRIIDKTPSRFDNRRVSDAWDNWERLRQNPEADPIEVLRAISAFQKYFAVEKEAVKVARSRTAPGMVGAALGKVRQALGNMRLSG